MPTADQKKYCPGLIHLRAQLRKLIAATNAQVITVEDEEAIEAFTVDETGVNAASEFAPELDGILLYQVGDAVLQVIYDGPYTEDNREEIINDTNARAEEILS